MEFFFFLWKLTAVATRLTGRFLFMGELSSGCAGDVTVISAGSETGETGSNSGRVCCLHFRIYDPEKGMNPSLYMGLIAVQVWWQPS